MDSLTQTDPYLKQVTTLGDTHQVVATEDILNDEGISLVKQGTAVNSSLYDRLVRHKLLRPLDYSLTSADVVSPPELITDVKRLLENEPELSLAVETQFIQRDLLTPLGHIRLEPPLAFKLTVCREQCPQRYQHLLRVSLMALYLATQLRWTSGDKQELATAALFHDLGEMHLEPSLFESSSQLTPAELRQIYAHPTIAYLFLREFPAYSPRISNIVHQHHERLDGSGYPKGLTGDEILPAARLLGAAEMLVVIRLEKPETGSKLYSTTEVLKLNAERFGCDLILPLVEAAKRIDDATPTMSSSTTTNQTVLQARLKLLVEILQGAAAIDTEEGTDMAHFVSSQMRQVMEMANRCGVVLNTSTGPFDIIGDDEQALSELDALVREMIFLVQSAVREAQRRWIKEEIPNEEQTPLAQWVRNTELALYSAGFQSEVVAETL
ncbi:MAG: HD domain-containing protein [Candidatus Thiodiazotropha sp. (ex Semelilucina semeliformis)]|nr:HD domain-containing protein [Candidatus Thiodiazotropha sp. (ex Semelilucina semeliformis)]